eukprot:2277625-Prorocentrum_lima.AAC.1
MLPDMLRDHAPGDGYDTDIDEAPGAAGANDAPPARPMEVEALIQVSSESDNITTNLEASIESKN